MQGGLGNQLFQYARLHWPIGCARLRLHTAIWLDRLFVLDRYPIDADIVRTAQRFIVAISGFWRLDTIDRCASRPLDHARIGGHASRFSASAVVPL
jgi:hypothetical protein